MEASSRLSGCPGGGVSDIRWQGFARASGIWQIHRPHLFSVIMSKGNRRQREGEGIDHLDRSLHQGVVDGVTAELAGLDRGDSSERRQQSFRFQEREAGMLLKQRGQEGEKPSPVQWPGHQTLSGELLNLGRNQPALQRTSEGLLLPRLGDHRQKPASSSLEATCQATCGIRSLR